MDVGLFEKQYELVDMVLGEAARQVYGLTLRGFLFLVCRHVNSTLDSRNMLVTRGSQRQVTFMGLILISTTDKQTPA